MAYVNLSHMPNPKQEYTVNLGNLNGGLNLSELEFRLKNNESPEMKNLMWREGVLCCRDGQAWVTDPNEYGIGKAMYERLFHGFLIAHIGDFLCYIDPEAENPIWIPCYDMGDPSANTTRGVFFLYYGKLYYKTKGHYVVITMTTGANPCPTGAAVTGYVPIIQINTDPTTAAGDLYQPENRMSYSKTVWYNAASGVTDYYFPVATVDSVVEVKVNGTTMLSGWSLQTTESGKSYVKFTTAPAPGDPPANNTVVITYSKAGTDATTSYNNIMDCPYAATYGGSGDLCVVMGGCPSQPNAIFWNTVGYGAAMDPSYFPSEQYQLCGNTDDPITGFGKQQSFLVIFKEHSIGRVKQDTTTLNERLTIDMPYTAINDKIGCDLPYTIQLIDNNLVWANLHQGVHILKDSSYAYENNIECVSKKVNGGETKPGMLANLREGFATSMDDSKRYWLVCNGKAWVWDYENTTYKDPSWYYMTNINAVDFAGEQLDNSKLNEIWHLDDSGRLTRFVRDYADYPDDEGNGGIEKRYRFAAQNFGGYDRLKNVNSVIFVVRPDTLSSAEITYITDYERRKDLTAILHYIWQLVPRNLSFRSLAGVGFGAAYRRRPMCRRVRHFAMQLDNNVAGQDLSIVSAQIFYNYQGRLR